jgi:hypothetical protein
VTDTAAPIDLVVLAMARTGAPIEETATRTGLSVAEARECLDRATRILCSQSHPVLSHAS